MKRVNCDRHISSGNAPTSWANHEGQVDRMEVFIASGGLSLRALPGRETGPAKTDWASFYLEQNYIIVDSVDYFYCYVDNEVLMTGLLNWPNHCRGR